MRKENPFKKLDQMSQDVPHDLRERVMDDINRAKLLMDLTGLFSINYVETLESLFKTTKRENNHRKNSEN